MELFPKQVVKNPTPQQIAITSAFAVSVFTVLLLVAFDFLELLELKWWAALAVGAVSFFSALLTFRFYLKKYIYRKVKVIYKSIHKHKLATNVKKEVVDMSSNIMEEVEKEVAEWADSQEKEIQQLKTWQEYRRKFLGDISHELKTPIFNIQGYLETLLDGGLEDVSINRTYLRRAATNVDRLNTIVEDLEIISRL